MKVNPDYFLPKYAPFQKASEYMWKQKDVNSQGEFSNWRDRPKFITGSPWTIYKDEWRGDSYFYRGEVKVEKLSFKEACEYLWKQKDINLYWDFKNRKDLHKFIPSHHYN